MDGTPFFRKHDRTAARTDVIDLHQNAFQIENLGGAELAVPQIFGKGLRPHLDFGVTGIDGLGTAYHPRPILTTVRTNTEEMGRMAVKSLLERIMKSPGAPATSLSPSPIFECGETL